MTKILPIERDGKKVGYCFKCPACGHAHKFCTADAHTEGWPVWELTGTEERPTVRASLLYSWNEGPQRIPMACHSFITDGKIEYCGDCTHELSGKTVDLPEFENYTP